MYCELTEIKEEVLEGQVQKHFKALAFTDESKTEVIAEQTLVVGGEALSDPEGAFLAGLASSTDDFIPSYVDMRVNDYPPIGDQLDALFKAGAFPADMAAQIQAVKDANPKPTA
jgi:hypothetical protein